MEEEARLRGAPPLGGLHQRTLRHAGHLRGPRQRPLPAVLRDLLETDRVRVDERVIEPVALDHDLQHAGEQGRVAPRLHRQVQVAGASRRRDARILDDDLRALFARLPDVVRGDGGALGHVRAGDPDHLGAHHVGPRVGRAVDAERLLVRGPGADHAQPAVVVDERRLEADARELAQQIGLLGREAGAAEDADGAGAVGLLNAADLGGHALHGLHIRQRAEPGRRGRVAAERRRQPIGVRALQVALHTLRTQHAAVEGELFPRFEANHLVVADLELNPALLPAEAAMRLHEPIGLDAGRQPHARHGGEMRSVALDDAKRIDRNFSHDRYPASRSDLARRASGGAAAATRLPAPARRARAGTSGRRPGSGRRRPARSESRAPARRW